MKLKTIAIALCSVAFAGAALAQNAVFKDAKLTARIAKQPDLKTCVDNNAKLDKEVDDMFKKAKAAGKIEPAEEAAYKAAEGRIAAHHAKLGQDGFSIADCKAMAADYAKEKQMVTDMVANTAKEQAAINACKSANGAAHKANLAALTKARAAKKVSPAEEAEFKKFEAEAGKHTAAMAKDGFTLADCKSQSEDIKKEAELIAKVAK